MTTKTYAIGIKEGIQLVWKHKELFFWVAALIGLYTADLHTDFTLCIPSHLGVENCPGCGIGHAITEAMHGNFLSSWNYHILGIPALVILLLHIAKLTQKLITEIKTHNYGHRFF